LQLINQQKWPFLWSWNFFNCVKTRKISFTTFGKARWISRIQL